MDDAGARFPNQKSAYTSVIFDCFVSTVLQSKIENVGGLPYSPSNREPLFGAMSGDSPEKVGHVPVASVVLVQLRCFPATATLA